MAIALRAAGTATAAAGSATAPAPAYPAGLQTGDLAVLSVGTKPFSATVATPTGWTLLGEGTNGTVAIGTDVGSTRVVVFGRVLDGTETGAVTLTVTSGNSTGAVINVYSVAAGATWDVSSATVAADSTNGANFSATGAANINLAAADWAHVTVAVNSDLGTVSAQDVTAAGATFGTVASRTNQAVTTGNDTRLLVFDRPVTGGPSTAAPVVTYTNASNTSGTALVVRLREIAPKVDVSWARLRIPEASTGTPATVAAPRAAATSTGRVPTLITGAAVTAPAAAASAVARTPTVITGSAIPATVTAPAAQATASSVAPTVTGGTGVQHVVDVSWAQLTVPAPPPATPATVTPPRATAAASARTPTILSSTPPPGAGRPRPVLNGGDVTLDHTVVSATHSWVVISGGGTLTGATTANPIYTAPSSGTGVAVIRDTHNSGTTDVTVGYGPTIVTAENTLTGTARATWDLPTNALGGVNTLQGFCDGFTRNRDETVSFKIAQSDTAGWTAQVYRLGWYGGTGARLVDELTPSGAQVTASQAQPAGTNTDPTRTSKVSRDCGNWSTTLTWTPPAWAASGMYVLRLNRTGGGASHVLFVVRDDNRTADLMFMPSDSTWQAYNAFGTMGAGWLDGNSLYYGTSIDQYNGDCARYVSYNRPIVNRAAHNVAYGAVNWSNFFTGEFPMLRFLERNGIDVKYYGCIDAAADPTGAKLANVNAAIFVGHNEYWTDGMRAGWEAARDNGTSVFSCAGNEVFWRVVADTGTADGSGRYRRYECQKSTINGRGNTQPEWTGTWRDPDGAGKGGNNPENTFTGTIFVVNGPDMRSLVVPFNGGYSAQPIWRHTSVAALTSGQSYTSPGQILGFEWDTYGPAGVSTTAANYLAAPRADVKYCSTATYSVSSGLLLTDAGDVYNAAGTATHRLVAYPAAAGSSMVFGTGTINWALGVDNANTYQIGNDNTDTVLQQATINVLTDMGAPASTLMAGLTAPTAQDWWPPATVVAPRAVATASAQPPTVTGGARIPATVAAPAAQATATGTAPTVTAGVRIPATITTPAASSTATTAAPTLLAGVALTAPRAAAAASSPAPAVVAGAVIAAPPAGSTATARVPTIVAGSQVPATVSAPRALAAATAPAPALAAGQTITPPRATATASSAAPTVTAGSRVPATVAAPRATATAVGRTPTVTGGTRTGTVVIAPPAAASATGRNPVIDARSRIPAVITPPRATATATGQAPAARGRATITAPRATATATGRVPTITAGVVIVGARALATATARAPGTTASPVIPALVTPPRATATALTRAPGIRVGVSFPTPDARIWPVQAEDRTHTVPPESRSVTA